LTERSAVEADYTTAVARGEFSNVWVDEILSEAGVEPDPPQRKD
jgi:hypothetical protein